MPSDEVHSWQVYAQRLLHSAACSTSGVGHLLHQAAEECQRPRAPFATVTSGEEKKRRRKKANRDSASAEGAASERTQPKRPSLTPEQLAKAKANVILKKLQKKRVRIDGKRTNLLELAKRIVHDRKVKEVAGDEPQIRDMSHIDIKARIPGQELRPGAFKMQLRAREEAQLPLDLLARGMTFSPAPVFGNFFGGRRDLTFGIYGRADEARKLLDEKWSGLPLEYVVGDPEFFEDVLDNAAQLELTVMALPARPLPQAALCEDLCQRLIKGMGVDGDKKAPQEEETASTSEDWKQLQNLASTFSDERLRGSQFVDKQGNLIEETHFIFSTLPDYSLLAEVITPGNLRDRKTYQAGPWQSKRLTRAALGMFLGPSPLDDQARIQAGQALVYFTNGFKLSPDHCNQAFDSKDRSGIWPKPSKALLEPSPEIFSLEGKGKASRLLDNVERRRAYFAS